jgi:O-antigen/teichoic acid export membrane protein
MTAQAPVGRLKDLTGTLRWSGAGKVVARTAGFNLATTVTAGLGGLIVARELGPTVRGEYAAITAWFGIACIIGQMGLPAALCFYVAKDPRRARSYVATSRDLMFCTGILALLAGVLLAPVLSRGNPTVADGYRIAFCASIVAYVGTAYIYPLQARNLLHWNIVRAMQPVFSLFLLCTLWFLRLLTLDTALLVLVATLTLQLGAAYLACRGNGLAPGHRRISLLRPLAGYGMAQIAALTPTALNAQLDQLVLSQTVAAADLGRYAIAVSLTALPLPLVSAVGNVAFPRLAAQRVVTEGTRRMQRHAIIASAGVAVAMLLPLSLVAPWLVQILFGARYSGAVPMIWMLAPGAVFLACGQVVGDLLRGRNHPAVVAWAQGLAAVFTVLLLIALLPLVGVYGAAIASTVAYGVALAVMLHSLWHMPRHARGSGWVPATAESTHAERAVPAGRRPE